MKRQVIGHASLFRAALSFVLPPGMGGVIVYDLWSKGFSIASYVVAVATGLIDPVTQLGAWAGFLFFAIRCWPLAVETFAVRGEYLRIEGDELVIGRMRRVALVQPLEIVPTTRLLGKRLEVANAMGPQPSIDLLWVRETPETIRDAIEKAVASARSRY